jgi:phosphoesterase RecJ-like protein
MLKRHKARIEGTEDFINFPRSIKGVKIALCFREVGKGQIKVGFRSNDNVDVCALAKMFGGGGHPQASGALIKASMGEAEEAVLLKAKKVLGSR